MTKIVRVRNNEARQSDKYESWKIDINVLSNWSAFVKAIRAKFGWIAAEFRIQDKDGDFIDKLSFLSHGDCVVIIPIISPDPTTALPQPPQTASAAAGSPEATNEVEMVEFAVNGDSDQQSWFDVVKLILEEWVRCIVRGQAFASGRKRKLSSSGTFIQI